MRSRGALAGILLASAGATACSGGSHHALPEKPRLYALPLAAKRVCARQQAHVSFVVLCPRRLPRAERPWPAGTGLPKLRAERLGGSAHPFRDPYGVEFSYGVSMEPTRASDWWQTHLWLNRPAYFLHFVVIRQPPLPRLPYWRLRRATLGGRRGLLLEAYGYGLAGSIGFYWANHDWFFFRELGEPYAASLHYFGRRTTLRLLDRLVRELHPLERSS